MRIIKKEMVWLKKLTALAELTVPKWCARCTYRKPVACGWVDESSLWYRQVNCLCVSDGVMGSDWKRGEERGRGVRVDEEVQKQCTVID